MFKLLFLINISLCCVLTMLVVLVIPAYAQDFEFGTLDLNYYFDGYYNYGNIDVVNTTGSLGNYIVPGVNFSNGELTFKLATSDSGDNSTGYHLVLSDTNNDNIYDPLTGMSYSSYDSNTFTDGEGINAIGPGQSLINLVDTWYTQTMIPYSDYNYEDIYISNIEFTGQVQLDNYSTTVNGITYSYDGTLDISGSLFDNNWYKVKDVAGEPGSSSRITGNIQEGPSPAPVPEPSTFMMFCSAAVCLFGLKNKFNKKI